jgi:hypothetical protein
MRAELRKAAPETVYLFKLTIDGTPYLFGETGAPWGPDAVDPRMISPGTVIRGVALRQNAIEFGSVDVILDDSDMAMAALFHGPKRNKVRGSPGILYLGSRNVAPEDWYIRFAGRLDTAGLPGPKTWTVTLSPNDLPLQRDSLPKPTVSPGDWPSAAVEIQDAIVPLIYGKISSASGTNTGAVQLMNVDSAGFRYLVCAGWAVAVDKVYADGVPVSPSAYSVTRPVVNGRLYTLVDFVADPGSSVTIGADVRGYESVGDGTGTLITDPGDVIKHGLANFIYNDYRSGPWLPDSSAPIDAASFARAKAFFSARGYQVSKCVKTKVRGQDFVNEILASNEAKACWTAAGNIALKVEDFTSFEYETVFVIPEDEVQDFVLPYPTGDLVDEINAEYGLVPATGTYSQKLTVKDFVTGETAPDSIQLPASPAFIL